MLDVLGFGENSVDYVHRLPQLPTAGVTKIPVRSRTVMPGGQVATTMAACARLGLRAGYCGTIGRDKAGQLIRESLEGRKVDLRYVMPRDAANRYAVILVEDRGGERVVLWERESKLAVRATDVRGEWVQSTRLLHVDGIDEEAAIVLARAARAAGIMVTCDLDAPPRSEAFLDAVTVPILAKHALDAISGDPEPERALRILRRRHPGMLIVTLGDQGAMLLEGDELLHEPALPVRVEDTTGAGDIFRAGVIYGLHKQMPARELLRFANAAAAASCTRAGAMASVPSREEVARLLGS